LKKLYLGTTIPKRIRQRNYNRFFGSLESLQNLNKLEVLAISSTNIDSGLEYLPESLEKMYCFNYMNDDAGCEKIRKELGGYFNKGKQYYDMQSWRRDLRKNN